MKYVPLLLLMSIQNFLAAQSQLDYNRSLEQPVNIGANWQVYDHGQCFIGRTDSVKRSGMYSLLMDGKQAAGISKDEDAPFTQTLIPADILKGKKKLRFTAWMRKDKPQTRAGIWYMQAVDMSTASLTAVATGDSLRNTRWQQIVIDVPIGDSAKIFAFGTLLNGPGKAWFDDVALYLDGKLVEDVTPKFNPLSETQVNALEKNSIALTSTTDTSSNPDLNQIAKWLAGVRVLGIGEPTHGNHEAATLKIRIFRYLVEHAGFDTWLTEDNYGECELLNAYIQNQAQNLNLKELTAGGRNKETVDLIEWMRNYNKAHDKKIKFMGFDLQSASRILEDLSAFAETYDSLAYQVIKKLRTSSKGLDKNWYDTTGIAGRWTEIMEDATAVQKVLTNLSENLPSKSVDSLTWLKHHQKVLAQFFAADYRSRTIPYRDSCMAANIFAFTMSSPTSRFVLTAHNMHVGAAGFNNNIVSMGSWLNRLMNEKYYRMGILIEKGKYSAARSFTDRTYENYPLAVPTLGIAEYYFSKVKYKDYVIRFTPQIITANPWLAKEIAFRSIGFMKDDRQFYQNRLSQSFNSIAFIRTGSPMLLMTPDASLH